MKPKILILMVMTLMLLATACASPAVVTQAPIGTPVVPGTRGTATATVTNVATQAVATWIPIANGSQPAIVTPSDILESDETLMINTEGEMAPNLVDDRGRSLYVYMNDEPNSSLSDCVDDCAVEWPPLTVSGTLAAAEGVDSTLVGTLSRPNGSTQATYNGWPLYYYNSDTIPGTTFGQSYKGDWFLISPDGEPIRR